MVDPIPNPYDTKIENIESQNQAIKRKVDDTNT